MKVFLSSTAQDLVAHRQVADDTILRLSQQVVAMERFGPLPGTPVEECERLARQSDVVVCIVAHRYGFVPEKGLGSITRREVEAAQAAGAYTPMGCEAAELYQRFVDLGGGHKDFSAIIKMIDDSWKKPKDTDNG